MRTATGQRPACYLAPVFYNLLPPPLMAAMANLKVLNAHLVEFFNADVGLDFWTGLVGLVGKVLDFFIKAEH